MRDAKNMLDAWFINNYLLMLLTSSEDRFHRNSSKNRANMHIIQYLHMK